MLTRSELLDPLARRRRDEVVVTTMSVVRPWGERSDSDLDFASADSAMGHAADLALGIAMARPERTVVCINGDGSMLMSLGTLATVIEAGVSNLVLFVAVNGTFEITGNQPIAAAQRVDFAGMARAAGFTRVFEFEDVAAYEAALDDVLGQPGPTFVCAHCEAQSEGPISRTPAERSRYLQTSLADWTLRLRAALADTEST